MKIPERIGYGKCKKCGRMHSTARFACLANRKERAMRLGINSSGTPVGENKPTYAQLESENARLRQAIDKVPRQDLLEIRRWMIEVIESDKHNALEKP